MLEGGITVNRRFLVLKKWLKEDRIKDLSGNFRVDRHIDMFCNKANKVTWIYDSFKTYKVIKSYLRDHHNDINVMLIFEISPSIKSGCIPQRLTVDSFEDVITPPSICLYRGERKDILCSDSAYLKKMSTYYGMDVYYHEDFDIIDKFFWRTVYML